MAKKGRRRERLRAPESEYRDGHGSLLVLRGALTPATRAQYAAELGGHPLSQEDAWQRAVEFLFERLAAAARRAARADGELLARGARRARGRLPGGRARRGGGDRRVAARPGERERERAGRRGPGAADALGPRPRPAARAAARQARGD